MNEHDSDNYSYLDDLISSILDYLKQGHTKEYIYYQLEGKYDEYNVYLCYAAAKILLADEQQKFAPVQWRHDET